MSDKNKKIREKKSLANFIHPKTMETNDSKLQKKKYWATLTIIQKNHWLDFSKFCFEMRKKNFIRPQKFLKSF